MHNYIVLFLFPLLKSTVKFQIKEMPISLYDTKKLHLLRKPNKILLGFEILFLFPLEYKTEGKTIAAKDERLE